jgi:hypothetical protein
MFDKLEASAEGEEQMGETKKRQGAGVLTPRDFAALRPQVSFDLTLASAIDILRQHP